MNLSHLGGIKTEVLMILSFILLSFFQTFGSSKRLLRFLALLGFFIVCFGVFFLRPAFNLAEAESQKDNPLVGGGDSFAARKQHPTPKDRGLLIPSKPVEKQHGSKQVVDQVVAPQEEAGGQQQEVEEKFEEVKEEATARRGVVVETPESGTLLSILLFFTCPLPLPPSFISSWSSLFGSLNPFLVFFLAS